LEWLGDLRSPEAVEELSVAVDRRAATWAAEVLDRIRARVEPTSWAAFYERMVERRPAREIAGELGLTIGAVYKAAERIKRMIIQECSDATPSSLPG
jgi:RNA polymerase sigma-70 factor (ECF subfamily)